MEALKIFTKSPACTDHLEIVEKYSRQVWLVRELDKGKWAAESWRYLKDNRYLWMYSLCFVYGLNQITDFH